MTTFTALTIGLIAGLAPGLMLVWWLTSRLRQTHTHVLEELRLRHEAALTATRSDGEALAQRRLVEVRAESEILAQRRIAEVRTEAEQATSRIAARNEDEARKLDRREEALGQREGGFAKRETKLTERESILDRRLEQLDRRDADLRSRELALGQRDYVLDTRETALGASEAIITAELTRIAALSPEAAKAEVLTRLDAELADEQAKRISRHEKDVQARAKELGVEIIGRAIQRYAAEHTADTTATKVPIKDEELKGRIIGKDGRNIKAFEQAAGVDLIIDETPGHILVSCFSGLRREIARRALLLLLEDGRIHPARIEEVLVKVQQDLDREVLKLGEDAAYACDVSGLHPQLLKLLGKLQWRTSYGQNVLMHTQEVAFLCGAMAGDLGLDPRLGRRCGLMHDIGKAIDHEQEGSHPVLGYEALKRYGESEIVANAALAHHEGQVVISTYTVLAAAADAISAARPGARRENVEKYLKRLAQLEEIACSFPGVQKAYAIQAGRELRVIVNGHTLADGVLPKMAHDIARRIEGEVAFPGEVRVTLIREIRAAAVAR